MKFRIVVLFLFSFTACFSQVEVTEYYSEKGEIVEKSKSTYYVKGIKTNNVFVGPVQTYFTVSGKLRSKEVRSFGSLDEDYIEYFESGNVKERGSFKSGDKRGVFEGFYSDGRQQYVFEYPENTKPEDDMGFFRIINYWDSTGVQLVTDGKGTCRCYSKLRNEIFLEHGEVSKGLREGKWTGRDEAGNAFEEVYKKGVLKEGVRVVDGKELVYNQSLQNAGYQGGLPGLAKFLQKNLRYPADARRFGVEGVVFIGFLIKENGELSEIKIENEIIEDLSNEALRVVKVMDKWVPQKIKGVPLRTYFVLPIKFKLES